MIWHWYLCHNEKGPQPIHPSWCLFVLKMACGMFFSVYMQFAALEDFPLWGYLTLGVGKNIKPFCLHANTSKFFCVYYSMVGICINSASKLISAIKSRVFFSNISHQTIIIMLKWKVDFPHIHNRFLYQRLFNWHNPYICCFYFETWQWFNILTLILIIVKSMFFFSSNELTWYTFPALCRNIELFS